MLQNRVLKVTPESGFSLSSVPPVGSHMNKPYSKPLLLGSKPPGNHAFPTTRDRTSNGARKHPSSLWMLLPGVLLKHVSLFLSITHNKTQDGKPTDEIVSRQKVTRGISLWN